MSANRKIGVEIWVSAAEARQSLQGVAADTKAIGDEATKTATRTSNAAAVAANGVASSSRAAAAAYGAQSTAAKGASVSQAQLQILYENVARSQGTNSAAAQKLAAELGIQSGATQAATLAQEELGAAQAATTEKAGLSAAQMLRMGGAADKLALGVNTGARQLSVLSAGLSATSLGTFAAVIGVSLLFGELLKLSKAKEEIFKADEEQIRLDVIQATLTGDKLRLNADVIASFHQIAAEQGKYQDNTRELMTALDNLRTKGFEPLVVINAKTGQITEYASRTTEELQAHIGDLTQKLADQEKAMQPAISSLISIRNLYGLNTDGLIAMAQALGFANKGTEDDAKALQFLRQQLDADLPSLRALANELGHTTNQMFDLERAALQTAIAVKQIKPPHLDMDFLRGQAQDPNEQIRRAQAAAAGGFTQGPPTSQQLEAAISPTLKDIRDGFRQNAAAVAANREEAKRLYDTYVSQLDPAFQGMIQRVDRASENMKVFNEHHAKGAAAARAHALEENNLAKQIQEASAALIGDNFASREAKIKADIAAEANALQIKKQLNAQSLAELTELERLKIEKVTQDRFAAEQRFQDELRQMQIRGITDAYERERAQIAFQLEKKAEALIQEFGLSKETTDKILAYRRATEDEFTRWFIDRQVQLNAELDRIAQQHDQKENAQITQGSGTFLTKQIEEFKKQEAAIDSIINKFQGRGGGAVQLFDMNELDHAATLMRQYGLTVEDVDKAFGSASVSVDQFNDRVDILTGTNLSAIDTLSQMVDWSHVLTEGIQAFTGAIEGAVAGTENLGRALLASFFKIIGEIAITLGTLFLLAAAGFLVLPGFQWSAGQLAAAGAALITFGAVMAGVGQRIAQGDQRQSGAASGGASGAASSGANSQRQGVAPVLISFPTSPASSGITISLDRQGTKDWLDGKEVLTRNNIKNKYKDDVRRVAKTQM
jgi:hypothetical protein